MVPSLGDGTIPFWVLMKDSELTFVKNVYDL
jgi:hypothetical protein